MALTDTTIPPITGIDDPAQARVLLYQAGRTVHAPLDSVGLATDTEMTAAVEAAIDGLATAETRNRIVNGAMQISQENSNTAGTVTGYYPADQWTTANIAPAVITAQRVSVFTPNGSNSRLRFTVSTIDASLAATDYWIIQTHLEGNAVVDFMYGTAAARQSVFRFGFKGPAGTYAFTFRNGATANRCYIKTFTISAGQANTDTEQVFVIPGDITGTWATNTDCGIQIIFSFAAGTNFNGVEGWQAGNLRSTSACTNGLATLNAVFELYDVGLYLDPLATDIAPPWVMPDEAEELAACQRYYVKFSSLVIDNSSASQSTTLPAPMRTSPSFSGGGAGFTTGTATSINFWVFQTTRANVAPFVASARM